jgi:integrase
MFVKANRGWLLVAHIPLGGEFVSQPLHLRDTRDNRREAKRNCEALEDARRAGALEAEFAKRFPNSRHLARLGLRLKVEPTLGEFAIETWLPEKVNLTPATRYDYECQLRFHVLPHALGAMRLGEITDGDVSRFVGDLQSKQTRSRAPLSARRINMVISRLRTTFATAHRRKLVAENPMLHVENLREPKSEVDPFDLGEVLRLVDAGDGWERSFLTVLLFTGMRPGEALALRWAAIDWDRGLILVRQTVSRRYGFGLPKTPGSERAVEMIGRVREALQEQRPRSQLRGELVFPSEKETAIDLANFRARNWERILKRARVRSRTLYQCRHTFARLAIEYGDTPQHLAAQLGHTSVEMVFRVYSRWMTRPASRLEALEKAITHPSPKVGGETAGSRGN